MKKLALVGVAFIGLCVLRAEEPRVGYVTRAEPGRVYYSTNLTQTVGEKVAGVVTKVNAGVTNKTLSVLCGDGSTQSLIFVSGIVTNN